MLGGGGIQRGAVIGKTNDNGTAVVDRQVDHANLFHTYLRAVGLDPTDSFDVGGRRCPWPTPRRSHRGIVGMSERGRVSERGRESFSVNPLFVRTVAARKRLPTPLRATQDIAGMA